MRNGGKFAKKMYLGKRKYYNPELAEKHREATIKFMEGAIFTAFLDLDGLINKSALARQYFQKSQGWFSQKLHGTTVCNKEQSFSKAEAHQLSESFRDIAKRLLAHADEIDNAEE